MRPFITYLTNRLFIGTFFLFIASFNTVISSEVIDGTWKGSVAIPRPALEDRIVLSVDDQNKPDGTIDIQVQQANVLPLIDSDWRLPVKKDVKDDAAKRERRTQQRESKLENIAAFIDTTRRAWNVPGLAIAIVKDDTIIYSKGFGYRNIKEKLPVTSETIFPIGSSTKAITVMGLGILADEGKLDLDKPVREYLTDFRLFDGYATEHMTSRDLVSHRSGLPRHDLMWYGASFTRKEMYRRLRYLEPSADFRLTWQYQNLMYMAAGYLIEMVSGSPWEDFTRNRILLPLGMEKSNFSVRESGESNDHARPYRLDENNVPEEIPFRDLTEIGPAGSINSNAEEMANWVRLNLSNGIFNNNVIVSNDVIKDMQTPHMVVFPNKQYDEIINPAYGLGWFIEAYRGYRYIHHGGNIDGFSALVSLLPSENLGVVVLSNLNSNPLPNIVSRYVVDVMLGLEPVDWHGRIKTSSSNEEAADDEDMPVRIENTAPTHSIDAFAGEYEHSGYGIILIEHNNDGLTGRFNSFEFDLEHWHYNVFLGTERDRPDFRLFFNFSTGLRGDIDRVSVPIEPSLEEVEFKRLP